MAEVKAFGALRFTDKAGEISELVCPPYDIISEDERKAYISQNEANIIRLELPREGTDPYATAGETFKSWLDDGIIACDSEDAFYIYEEEFEVFGQIKKLKGIIGRIKLESFDKGVVLPHEETLSKAKADRFNLMSATGCNFSSVYSLYFDEKQEAFSRIEKLSSGKADVEFTSSADGIIHRMWIVTDKAEIAALSEFFKDKKLYIADGHHRYQTALNYQKHLIDSGIVTDDSHPANYIMMTLVNMEHPGLVVFPTHRLVRSLENFDAEKLIADCEAYFSAEAVTVADTQAKLDEAANAGKKAFALYHNKKVTLLTLKDTNVMAEMLPEMSAAYCNLDVSILHTLVLERILGIDKENMANQKNLIYIRDMADVIAAVDNGEGNCGFIINPTLVDEIAAVAGAGEKMPQKSTYFYPKLITGHVMNKIL